MSRSPVISQLSCPSASPKKRTILVACIWRGVLVCTLVLKVQALSLWVISPSSSCKTTKIRADFWAGDPTKHFSVKKRGFQWKGGRDSVNEGFGKDFYRKGNSVKRSGPFSEPPDSENWKVADQIHFPKISSYKRDPEHDAYIEQFRDIAHLKISIGKKIVTVHTLFWGN